MSKDKPLPPFSSDEEAEDFVDSADLTGYDLSALTPTRFEFGSKDARVNVRMPAELLEQVKAVAASKGCRISGSFARRWSRRCTVRVGYRRSMKATSA